MKAKKDCYHPDVLAAAQSRRQAVIDVLNAQPGIDYYTLRDSVMALDKSILESSMKGTLSNMIHRREIQSAGGKGCCTFIALVSRTISADEILAERKIKDGERKKAGYRIKSQNKIPSRIELRAKREADRIEAEKKARKAKPVNLGQPIYTHRPGQIADIERTHSRGQGAVRQRAYINAFRLY